MGLVFLVNGYAVDSTLIVQGDEHINTHDFGTTISVFFIPFL